MTLQKKLLDQMQTTLLSILAASIPQSANAQFSKQVLDINVVSLPMHFNFLFLAGCTYLRPVKFFFLHPDHFLTIIVFPVNSSIVYVLAEAGKIPSNIMLGNG